jgi:hypothetical protein
MAGIGEGIAFAGLCIAAAWLEVTGNGANGLWVLIVLWAIFSDFK